MNDPEFVAMKFSNKFGNNWKVTNVLCLKDIVDLMQIKFNLGTLK